MVARKQIRDANDQVVDTAVLTEEVGAPTIMGVRQVRMEHPSYRLSPEGLALILRNSEQIDPSFFFSLCMDIEEREAHYRSVLGTRKTQVSQVPITVIAADVPDGEKHAQAVRDVVDTPDFPLHLVDVLDGLGKGISWTELVWDVSEGQYVVKKIAWRDPRWFRFDIADLTTGMLINPSGYPDPLDPYKWIAHRPKLLSGIPVRNGLTRCAAWCWAFKNFAIKDWMIFLDVFGMPLRLGKYPGNATTAEKKALLMAVSSLGSDAAAIIPSSMSIEFPGGSGPSGATGSPFKEAATYFDEQVSKLVLGQTGTTDAVAGGSRGLGQVQDSVRGDVERADCVQLSATLSRDIGRPIVDLNFGPQKRYPLIKIGRPEDKDVEATIEAIQALVPMGFRVAQKDMYDLVGLEVPQEGDELLVAPAQPPGLLPGDAGGATPPPGDRADAPGGRRGDSGEDVSADDSEADPDRPATILAASTAPGLADADWANRAVDALIADQGWLPDGLDDLAAKLAKCTTEAEAQAVLAEAFAALGTDKLAELLAKARFNARGEGIVTPTH